MNQQFFNTIATTLGGTFIPAKWHSDEPAADDRGYIFFGDPKKWQTPSIFLNIGGWRKEGKVSVTTNGHPRFINDAGCVREMKNSLPYSFEAVMSVSKGAAACAKDIKRRVVDPMLAAHPAALADIEVAIAKEEDRRTWMRSVGIRDDRDSGTVWLGKNYARASIDHVYTDVNMSLNSLSRAQAEAVIKTLQETT